MIQAVLFGVCVSRARRATQHIIVSWEIDRRFLWYIMRCFPEVRNDHCYPPIFERRRHVLFCERIGLTLPLWKVSQRTRSSPARRRRRPGRQHLCTRCSHSVLGGSMRGQRGVNEGSMRGQWEIIESIHWDWERLKRIYYDRMENGILEPSPPIDIFQETDTRAFEDGNIGF